MCTVVARLRWFDGADFVVDNSGAQHLLGRVAADLSF